MTGSGIVLAARQLVELLAAVSSFSDEPAAARGAAERAAQAFEAEVAAVVVDGVLLASVGFPVGRVPEAELVSATPAAPPLLSVPGVGECPSLVVWMADHSGHLLVARAGEDDFTTEDRHLLRGMAQIFHLTLRMIRTLAAERGQRRELEQHQALLEHLLTVQHAITQRQPLPQILDAITAGAADLLGVAATGLWLLDPQDATQAVLAAQIGLSPGQLERASRMPVTAANPLGSAIRGNGLARGPSEVFGAAGWALAVPVHESGGVAGAIMVGGGGEVQGSGPDPDVLTTFAHHVSLALTDARTLQAVHEAHHDSLTGLPNRALFLQQSAAALSAAAGDVHGPAVCFIDLDRFKWVNDTLGHAAGDALLVHVAQRVRGALRPTDVVGRLGGDEFAIVLRNLPRDEVEAVARRIQEAIAQPLTLDGRRIDPGASVGVAHQHDGADVHSLLREADVAMYEAKRHRRGLAQPLQRQAEWPAADRADRAG